MPSPFSEEERAKIIKALRSGHLVGISCRLAKGRRNVVITQEGGLRVGDRSRRAGEIQELLANAGIRCRAGNAVTNAIFRQGLVSVEPRDVRGDRLEVAMQCHELLGSFADGTDWQWLHQGQPGQSFSEFGGLDTS